MNHALLGMPIDKAIRLVVWGNGGELTVLDRDSQTNKEYGSGDFRVIVAVKQGVVTKIGSIRNVVPRRITSEGRDRRLDTSDVLRVQDDVG